MISYEHMWLEKIIGKYRIDAVISDNRYGLWTDKIPCVFITHQLQIAAPGKWFERKIQQINYRYINRYTECWIPDFEGAINIAGKLSHPVKMPATAIKYIGALSRLQKENIVEKKYKWFIILSGPEPQRSMLEEKLLAAVPALDGFILLARGKPGSTEKITTPQNCTVANHLSTTEMQQAFAQSEFVVSRSGYTTVMDILSLQKKSILIPTPGQTEQEYLAKHLMQLKWCYAFAQSDENILQHLQNAKTFDYDFPHFEESSLQESINTFLQSI